MTTKGARARARAKARARARGKGKGKGKGKDKGKDKGKGRSRSPSGMTTKEAPVLGGSGFGTGCGRLSKKWWKRGGKG
jgi:hypothetical protein